MLKFNMYMALMIIIVFLVGMFYAIGLSYASEGGFQGSDQTDDKQEAINSYLGDDHTSRARWARESEGYKVWHTIDELNRKDNQQRLIDRNFIINQRGKKIKI